MSFTLLDIVFAVIVLLFAFTAWRRGFVGEVLGKLAPVVSLLVAALFFGDVAPLVVKVVPVPHTFLAVVAFIVLFVATFVVIKLLQILLGGIVNSIDVLKVNKLLGLVLGVIEGLFIVSVIMIVLLSLPIKSLHDTVQHGIFWSLLGAIVSNPVENVQHFLSTARDNIKAA